MVYWVPAPDPIPMVWLLAVVMIGWHVACHWAAGDPVASKRHQRLSS